jgi:murein DD-endopeptidase MepM/ murein hydrolase activator NlpD
MVSILKEEYKKIIQVSYKNKDRKYLIMLILSSKDFNSAYKRVRFFQQLLDYRKSQVSILQSSILNLQKEKEKLSENILKLNLKQKEKQVELINLNNEKTKYNNKLRELKKRKNELLNDLEKKRSIEKKLGEEINRLVEEEARRIREEKNKSKIREHSNLSINFRDNYGKFNKPIDSGILTGLYGESNHPILKGVKVKNNGVDFTISEKSNVYSIFEGEVRKIITIPGSGVAVIVRHGNYLTVYSNLTRVNVKVNQKVSTNQKIGEIDKFNNNERNILHFEIWNENKTENPERWLNTNVK